MHRKYLNKSKKFGSHDCITVTQYSRLETEHTRANVFINMHYMHFFMKKNHL